MITISLTQPWATLVQLGHKRIETRSWNTRYRGALAIHAAKGFPTWAKDTCDTPPFREVLRSHGLGASDLPRGVMLCLTSLDATMQTEKVAEFSAVCEVPLLPHELAFGDYSPERWAWILGRDEKRRGHKRMRVWRR